MSFPLPHSFCTQPLQSNLSVDLSVILNQVNELLPQLSNFIIQFNNIIIDNSVNVITETNGNMSLDVPMSMPDAKAEQLSKRINIIDRLINNRSDEIKVLLNKGLEIEKNIREKNPQFNSQILEKVNELKKLNNSYKH